MVGAPAALAAEGRGTIGGRVTDRDVRTPIPSVRVTLRVQPLVPKPSTLPASLSRRLAPAGPRVEPSRVVLGDLNGARLPAYQRLDLRLRRSLPVAWGLLDFRLDLLNALNRPNVRSIDLSFDAPAGTFYETTSYQSPFLPVLSLSAEF